MSNFVDNKITNAGVGLLAEMQLGAKFVPTKIVMGSGRMPASATPETMTDVVTPEAELEITKKERVNGDQVALGGVYSNEEIDHDFYFRELGVYAKAIREDGTVVPECLYSYGNAGDAADLMAAYHSGAAVERQIDLVTYVGNDAVVDLSIASDTFITMDDLKAMLSDLQAGSGIPPNDMQTFTATSTESGIKLDFKGPANSYLYGAANNDTLGCVPEGFMIRYSDTGYPVNIDDGELVGVYDIDPVNPVAGTQDVVGLTFEETYYFTAFPFSTEGVYNKSQAPANRASAQWVGNKGTINVTVQAYEGYLGTIGEYTITLVDQAESDPQNITKQASGTGLTQIGNLEAGKTYVVTLTDTNNLTSDPSEPITIEAGLSYNVTMTYREKYGSISVTVNTASDFATLGEYTITLLDQAADSPSNVEKQATGKGVTTFDNLISGKQYKVRLGATANFIPPADSDVITVVGGETESVTMTYAAGMGSVVINVSTNPTGMPIGSYTITLTPTAGGSSLQQSRSGSGSITFNSVPIGTYNITGSSINHYTFRGGQVSVTGGQQSSHNVNYGYSASFAEATWAEIQAIAQTGLASNYYSVGDSKVTSSQNFILIGINRDLSNSITVFAPNNYGTGSYDAFERTPTVGQTLDAMNGKFGLLPSEVQAVCKQVTKYYYDGHSESSGRPISGNRTVYFFTLSANEVGLTSYYESIKDVSMGTQYPYFSSNDRRIINLNGGAISWYLRSCAQQRGTTGCVTPQGSITSSKNNVYYIGAFVVG